MQTKAARLTVGQPGWQQEVDAAVSVLVDGHDRDERVAACRRLASQKGGQTFLEDATEDGSPHVRSAAVDALGSFEQVGYDRWVIPHLRDENPFVRQSALGVVRRCRLHQAHSDVLRLSTPTDTCATWRTGLSAFWAGPKRSGFSSGPLTTRTPTCEEKPPSP